MPECLIVQPIHPAGEEALEAAGIRVRRASAQDMKTVAAEIETADALITRDAGQNADGGAERDADQRIEKVHGLGGNLKTVQQEFKGTHGQMSPKSSK